MLLSASFSHLRCPIFQVPSEASECGAEPPRVAVHGAWWWSFGRPHVVPQHKSMLLVASLLLVVRPGAPSSFLLLVVRHLLLVVRHLLLVAMQLFLIANVGKRTEKVLGTMRTS